MTSTHGVLSSRSDSSVIVSRQSTAHRLTCISRSVPKGIKMLYAEPAVHTSESGRYKTQALGNFMIALRRSCSEVRDLSRVLAAIMRRVDLFPSLQRAPDPRCRRLLDRDRRHRLVRTDPNRCSDGVSGTLSARGELLRSRPCGGSAPGRSFRRCDRPPPACCSGGPWAGSYVRRQANLRQPNRGYGRRQQ